MQHLGIQCWQLSVATSAVADARQDKCQQLILHNGH